MTTPLRFHFDFLSPYAYLAWKALPDLATRHGRSIEAAPVLLAALLHHHGNVGPAEVPAKRTYAFKDCLRHAHRLGLTLTPPPTHPFRPLLPLRICSLEMATDTRHALVSAFFDRTWAGGGGLEDPDALEQIARSHGVSHAVSRASEPTAKAALRAHTERAIAAGVFGVPSVVVDGELFWGLDSFGHLDRHLTGDRPDLDTPLSRWKGLSATATRTR
jgi:2-hydroxychromene-2-carboxylate isomerase